MTHRLLVMTYEFPPTGGAGVQRIAKFSKYLPEEGWDIVAVTARPSWGRPHDPSLCADVGHVTIHELAPRNVAATVARVLSVIKPLLRRRPASNTSTGSSSAVDDTMRTPLSTRISQRLSVPDHGALWARAAVKAGVAEGRRNRVDAVLASGPPFSVLWAGACVAEGLGVPFVADMRDTWADNYTYKAPPDSRRTRVNEGMVKTVYRVADAVTCATAPVAQEALRRGARRAEVVFNGYDDIGIPQATGAPGDALVIGYMGAFYAGFHDPTRLLHALHSARSNGADVRLVVAGPRSASIERIASDIGLAESVSFLGFLPHGEALTRMAATDVGLVVLNDSASSRISYPGKLFEYLGMGLPVLAIGPSDGITSAFVSELSAGLIAEDTPEAITRALLELAAMKRSGTLPRIPGETISRYTRRRQTHELAQILDDLIS